MNNNTDMFWVVSSSNNDIPMKTRRKSENYDGVSKFSIKTINIEIIRTISMYTSKLWKIPLIPCTLSMIMILFRDWLGNEFLRKCLLKIFTQCLSEFLPLFCPEIFLDVCRSFFPRVSQICSKSSSRDFPVFLSGFPSGISLSGILD